MKSKYTTEEKKAVWDKLMAPYGLPFSKATSKEVDHIMDTMKGSWIVLGMRIRKLTNDIKESLPWQKTKK